MKSPAMISALVLACCFAGAVAGLAGRALQTDTVSSSGVTPVQKVIALLTKLETEIEEEGKKEAAAYDKYACFCKEQVDEKQYSIGRGKKKAEELSAQQKKLQGLIGDNENKLRTLQNDAKRSQDKARDLAKDRSDAKAKSDKHLADVEASIQATTSAIEALKDAKNAASEDSLLQLKAAATAVLSTASHTMLSDRELGQMRSLSGVRQPGEADAYEYKSNDIIVTIESMLIKFKKAKTDIEDDWFKFKTTNDKAAQFEAHFQDSNQKVTSKKEGELESQQEELSICNKQLGEVSADLQADESFFKDLVVDCETKAKLWDQRSQSRSDEINAISQAMSALKKGVAPNYGANKKLVELQTSTRASEISPRSLGSRAPTLLQVRNDVTQKGAAAASAQSVAVSKVQDLLRSSDSPILAFAALKVGAAKDNFAKVRGLIKDLISKLAEEAANEKTQKSFCDTNMKKAITTRDEEQANKESLMGDISANSAKSRDLAREVGELSSNIADNKKSLLEASTLRSEEAKDNQKTLKDASAGLAAVTAARKFLTDYYEKAALLQTKGSASGPDLGAPDTISEEYGGKQSASKGVLGLLDVILSDFERTIDTVKKEESDAAKKFDELKQKNEDDTDRKAKLVTEKEKSIADIKIKLVELKDKLKEADKLHSGAMEELGVLHKKCVVSKESYDEKRAKRQKEIDELKRSLKILETVE